MPDGSQEADAIAAVHRHRQLGLVAAFSVFMLGAAIAVGIGPSSRAATSSGEEPAELVAAAAPSSLSVDATPPTIPGAVSTTLAPESTTLASSAASTTLTPPTVPPAVASVGECPARDGSSPRVTSFTAPPPTCIDPNATYRAAITTTEGTVTVLLDTASTPIASNVFVYLARYHFYDGLQVVRTIPGFLFQTGDPKNDGSGGPGFTFVDELPRTPGYPVGAVAMANLNPARPNSNGSQFFVITGKAGGRLPSDYPLFARVVDGLSVAKSIAALGTAKDTHSGTPSRPVTVTSITITADGERSIATPSTTAPPSLSTTNSP